MTPLPLWKLAIWCGVLGAVVFVGLFVLIAWWPALQHEARVLNRWLFPPQRPYVLSEEEKHRIREEVHLVILKTIEQAPLSDKARERARRDVLNAIMQAQPPESADLRLLRGGRKS